MACSEVFAPAKINLTLAVTGRRPDGYHELESLVVFARELGDRVAVRPAGELSLSVSGPLAAGVPTGEDNLVMRAARRLAAARGVTAGAAITLEKCLPHGGGLGGGSSDAAAAIKALAALWGVAPLEGAEALALGADLPVCLAAPVPQVMRGIGEILSPVKGLPELHLVLVNPGVHLDTGAVFRTLARLYPEETPPGEALPEAGDFEGFHGWLLGQHNALTKCAAELDDGVPEVLAALRALPDCRDADMSGSGSTCWSLFESAGAAALGAGVLAARHPGWWIRPCAVAGS